MTTPRFFVAGQPAGQGSKRHVGNGRMIEQSKKVKPWREQIARTARQKYDTPIAGPVALHIEFIYPRPKKLGMHGNDHCIVPPDIDKACRAVGDALTGIAYIDDKLIVELHATKRRAEYGEQTGAHITITPL